MALRSRTEDHRSLNQVFQLANIPGPGEALHELQGSRGEMDVGSAGSGLLAQEVVDQDRKILHPLAQRRNPQLEYVGTVKKLLPESAVFGRSSD
jgi:hypothetical protein